MPTSFTQWFFIRVSQGKTDEVRSSWRFQWCWRAAVPQQLGFQGMRTAEEVWGEQQNPSGKAASPAVVNRAWWLREERNSAGQKGTGFENDKQRGKQSQNWSTYTCRERKTDKIIMEENLLNLPYSTGNMQYGLLRQKIVGEVTYLIWREKVLLMTRRTRGFVTISAMHVRSRLLPGYVSAPCAELSAHSLMAPSWTICRPLVWTQSFNVCLDSCITTGS